jgi:ribosomal-protein-alanine N-acetyltransferase
MSDGVLDITICPMREEDLDGVEAIEALSYPRPWSRTHFLDELKAHYAFPLVAMDADGRLLGYICPTLLFDEGHILNVAVDPASRGKGVGRLLVERVIRDCRAGGAEIVSLEVRTSNLQALELYKSLGFKETGLRKGYYENGEDALLMEYSISDQEDAT